MELLNKYNTSKFNIKSKKKLEHWNCHMLLGVFKFRNSFHFLSKK